MWKLAHDALITNQFRWRRGFAESNICPICSREEKSAIHLMRECVFARQVWSFVADNALPHSFLLGEIQSWICTNLKNESQRKGVKWHILFGIALLSLWQCRNELIFQGMTPVARVVGRMIFCQALAYQQSEEALSPARIRDFDRLSHRNICWLPPEVDTVKLNCDASVIDHGEDAGIGGLAE